MEFDGRRLLELLRNPAEDLAFEVKEWLDLSDNAHRAKLAQAIIALANHGGGAVLIGYAEQADGAFIPAHPRPPDLSGYSSDTINDISRAYLNPPIHCEVRHVAHPVSGQPFPFINVPGGHRVPIMAKRGGPQGQSSLQAGRTYIRRVGPSSEEPQSPQEWQALFDRCIRAGREELADQIRLIVAGAPLVKPEPTSTLVANDELLDGWIKSSKVRWQSLLDGLPKDHPARFPLGYYQFAYQLLGQFNQPSLPQLRDALTAAEVKHTGWPHWPVFARDPLRPRPVDDTIECFLAYDKDSGQAAPDTLDYWRVSRNGMAYTVRGLNEDSHPDLGKPGQGLDIVTPTRRFADALTHAANLARQVGMTNGLVQFDATWLGLAGRKLVSWGNSRRFLAGTYRTSQPRFNSRFFIPVVRIVEQLPEIVDKTLRPMYEAFDFFQLPADLVPSEIAAWRRGT